MSMEQFFPESEWECIQNPAWFVTCDSCGVTIILCGAEYDFALIVLRDWGWSIEENGDLCPVCRKEMEQ